MVWRSEEEADDEELMMLELNTMWSAAHIPPPRLLAVVIYVFIKASFYLQMFFSFISFWHKADSIKVLQIQSDQVVEQVEVNMTQRWT